MKPVVVFKNNWPFDDFVGMPISSRLDRLNDDEVVVDQSDFTEGVLPKRSKTFVISKQVIVKRYGTLTSESFRTLHRAFCGYFGCD